MKRIFKYIPFLVISLFCFLPSVSAKNVMINYDVEEKFNYFYEEKNNTEFYRYLLSHQNNLSDILYKEYSGADIKSLLLFNVNELPVEYSNKLKAETYYVILSSPYTMSLFYDDNNIRIGPDIYNANQGWETVYSYATFYCYDAFGNYIGYYKTISDFNNDLIIDIGNDNGFTYLLSKLYYSVEKIKYNNASTGFPDLVVNRYKTNDKVYYIDDNENYSEFLKWIITIFTSARNSEVEDSYLEYFKLYKYMTSSTGANPLTTILSYKTKTDVSVPGSYVNVSLDGNEGIFLIPKKKINNSNNKVYISSTGKPKLSLNYFTFNEDNTLSLLEDYRADINIYTSNSVGYLNLLSPPNKGNLPTSNYYDYVYWLVNLEQYDKNEALKYEVTIYYNPDYYEYYWFTGIQDYYLDIFGSEHIISSSEIEGANHSGSAVDIFSPIEDQQQAVDDEDFWNSSDLGDNVVKASKGIGSSAVSIVNLVSITFNSLPIEIRSIFYISLVIGFLILFKKLIVG